MKTVVVYIAMVISCMAFIQKDVISIHMIGDSTMSIKETKARPETGWGEPFSIFFDESVRVVNHAKNGRSTRSFVEEGRWDVVMKDLKKGDYVIIQFGHNDEVQTKKTSTNPDEFKANLVKYVKDTQSQGAIPILLTSVARRHFDESGFLIDTHKEFADIVRRVGSEEEVYFIDMDSISRGELTRLGDEASKLLYLQLEAGDHPNYPEGKIDNTHFSEYGARVWAQMILDEMEKLELEPANRLTKGRYVK
ncbi:rhamnogalacturonan acetylesterase [Marinoscillum sp. MHG1-6]|uniref:rhamnogalacturonan acetylesterase n=1 Tax=Marinoscillum sp. MHG1-6 TaxID=2959627 RepID=UPI0021578E12|nr:rhamnogalacturonan acetylesterase [Marinoscillum sp. MHG1-6]